MIQPGSAFGLRYSATLSEEEEEEEKTSLEKEMSEGGFGVLFVK